MSYNEQQKRLPTRCCLLFPTRLPTGTLLPCSVPILSMAKNQSDVENLTKNCLTIIWGSTPHEEEGGRLRFKDTGFIKICENLYKIIHLVISITFQWKKFITRDVPQSSNRIRVNEIVRVKSQSNYSGWDDFFGELSQHKPPNHSFLWAL